MSEFFDDLRQVIKQSGRSIASIAQDAQISKTTLTEIMSSDQCNPTISTVESILRCVGAELEIQTARSRQAIAQQDVSWYREELNRRDATIESLRETLDKANAAIAKKDARIEKMLDALFGEKYEKT